MRVGLRPGDELTSAREQEKGKPAAPGRRAGRPARVKRNGARNGRASAETLAMLSVSRGVARGGPLADLLEQIAREAAGVVGARSSVSGSLALEDPPVGTTFVVRVPHG